MQSAPTEYQQMFAKVQSIDAERMRLESREVALNDLLDSFGKEMWAITSKPNSYLERKYGKEIADIWKDFEISDPYAMCFAFMSLLDKGSDLRKYNIPLRYFAYSGVSKCAEQFVREDKKVQ